MRKIDIDQAREATEAADVEAYPTFKVYKNGAETGMLNGADEPGLI